MQLTNKFNLPTPIVKAAERDKPKLEFGEIRVTTLIGAPKVRLLKNKHWKDLEVDVSNSVWSIFGSGIHTVLEQYAKGIRDNTGMNIVQTEQTMTAKVEATHVSGTIDLIEVCIDGEVEVTDYKTTTAWASQQEKPEWETQLNCYAYILRRNGIRVKALFIVALLRDWSRRDANDDSSYPQSPIIRIPIPLWEFDLQESYVLERVQMHEDAFLKSSFDEKLPDCTESERWYRPGKYAVHTNINSKAIKLFTEEKEAIEFAKAFSAKQKKQTLVVSRSGKSSKCYDFCEVSKFCDQFNKKIKQEECDTVVYDSNGM